MKTIKVTLEEAQASFDELWHRAVAKQEVIIISRPACEDVALIAAREFSSLNETQYLLSSQKNAKRLLAAPQRARQGNRDRAPKARNGIAQANETTLA
ncbi:MAG: type II toxin-antitoxin system prevent-host-death family antitoxin [bacterium]